MFNCAVKREGHCKQISLAWVGMLAVSGPQWVCPRSWHVCFPGLHCSGSRLLCRGTVKSGPWVACTSQIYAAQVQVLTYSTKAQTPLVGPVFCAFPRSEQLRRPYAWRAHTPSLAVLLITSPIRAAQFPGCAAGASSQGCRVAPLRDCQRDLI